MSYVFFFVVFLIIRMTPRSTRTATLFPYATVLRSLHANLVRSFRGYGVFDDGLIGAAARLAAGDEVRLLVHASFLPRYPGSASDVAAAVEVTATVEIGRAHV